MNKMPKGNQVYQSAPDAPEQNEYYVGDVPFKSKRAKKENENFYVSKMNKPAKKKENGGFFSTLMYRFGKDDTSGLAAQLAYYFMLSLFPLLIFLLTLIPLMNIDQSTITNMIEQNAPGQTSELITGIIEDVMKNSGGGILSFGLLMTLWTASNGMTALMNAFNVAYDVEDNRNAIVAKLLSVLFTVIMISVLLLSLVLIVFGKQIGDLLFGVVGLNDQFTWVWNLVRGVLPVIVIFIVFSMLYFIAPNLKVTWKSIWPGALFATIVWLGATYLFGFYVSNFGSYSKTYGSIAGVIILMLWLYLTGVIIILGAQINAIKHHRKRQQEGF